MIFNEFEEYIDLNTISPNFELQMSNLDRQRSNIDKTMKFNFEETDVHEATSSIKYDQFGCRFMIQIFGPRECKYRDKMKTDTAIIETYIKMNYEANKESKIIL
jgi:hypothetical protein